MAGYTNNGKGDSKEIADKLKNTKKVITKTDNKVVTNDKKDNNEPNK